ncbi:phosphotransferase [Schaalia sp. 19OD2882]|uniref:phosphotransferase enzyme family protein n=1 Tax=Schaalia sp. 19OD2882 TaxID=2794089 RepID=UPI001C1ED7A5|nr:phosphotransferase [Schaalia sp. 19OD2882]QWW19117.1 phosphotransferase [Schaalia sp. 19OD2882]
MDTSSRLPDRLPGDDPQMSVVDPVWPVITREAAGAVLGALASPVRATRVLTVSSRPMAAASLVDTDAGPLFLKRYGHASVRPAHLEATHRFVAHLADHGVPTPRFLPFSSGRTAMTCEDGIWEVCGAARGEDRYRLTHSWQPPRSTADAHALGRAGAEMALASASFDQPRQADAIYQSRLDLLADADPRGRVHEWLGRHRAVTEVFELLGADVDSVMAPHFEAAARLNGHLADMPTQWTHGDLHVSNAFWDEDGVCDLVDFGLADRNVAVLDLAVMVERNAFEWLEIMNGRTDAVRRDIAEALVRGWHEVRPLDPAERAALPAIMPVVQSEFALNVIEYQWGVLGNEASARWALDVFLGAHTTWFTCPQGRQFTAWLGTLMCDLPEGPASPERRDHR